MKTKLTTDLCKRLDYFGQGGIQYPDGAWKKIVIRDTEIPGFGLRLLPSGRKYFILRYMDRSKFKGEHTISLGEFPSLPLPRARQLAHEKRAMVYSGHPPHAERAKHTTSFKELAQRFLEEYSDKRKKTANEDKRRIDKYLIPEFGKEPVQQIKRSDIARLHMKIGATAKVEANRVLSLISVIYRQAKVWGLVDDDVSNPAQGIETYDERARERVLSEEEALNLLKAADKHADKRIGPLVRLYLLTGARRNELLRLMWENVNLETGEIRFIDTKAGRDHVIIVSPEAIEQLKHLEDFREEENPYVFPGRNPGSPRFDFKKPWTAILKEAKVSGVTVHDLRRTVGTWLAKTGESEYKVQKVLNQEDDKATRHYVHLSGEETREPLSKLGRIVHGLFQPKKKNPQKSRTKGKKTNKRQSRRKRS